MLKGLRPKQPANASSIGFSDSLWEFVQRCWGHNMNSRPKVSEVVTQLAKAAASWRGVMPPCSQAENTVHVSEAPISESMQHCTFESFIPLGIAYRMMMQVEFLIPRVSFRRVPQIPEPVPSHSAIRVHHLQLILNHHRMRFRRPPLNFLRNPHRSAGALCRDDRRNCMTTFRNSNMWA